MKKKTLIGMVVIIIIILIAVYIFGYFSNLQSRKTCQAPIIKILYIDNSTDSAIGTYTRNPCENILEYSYATNSTENLVSKENFTKLINKYNKSCSGCVITK